MPVDKSSVQRFMAIFRGNPNHHGRYKLPSDLDAKGKGRTEKKPLTERIFNEHLNGTGDGLGLAPIKDDRGHVYFGAIDWDDKNVDHIQLAKDVAEWGMPLVVCRSRRGGAHLYCFVQDGCSADVMKAKLEYFISLLDIQNPPSAPGKKPQPVEIFPKQSASEWRKEIKAGTDPVGNWINLPYYKGDKTNRYGFDKTGEKLTLSAFLNYAESMVTTETKLKIWTPQIANALGEGSPPCLEVIHKKGTNAGEKGNNYLFNIGVYYKMSRPDTWREDLEEYNSTLEDPMSDSDMKSTLRSLDRKDYAYSCEQYPINDFCNKGLCRTRKFGVGNFGDNKSTGGGSVNLASLPAMENLVQHNTIPPFYSVTVFGKRVTMTDEEWFNFKSFQKKVYNSTLQVFPSMGQPAWLNTIATLFPPESVVVEIAPDEASASGKLKIFLIEYLGKYTESEDRNALLKGLPYLLETKSSKRIYFHPQDFAVYLSNEKNFRDYSKGDRQPELWLHLKTLGVDSQAQIKINGKNRRMWSAPFSLLDDANINDEIHIEVEDNPEF